MEAYTFPTSTPPAAGLVPTVLVGGSPRDSLGLLKTRLRLHGLDVRWHFSVKDPPLPQLPKAAKHVICLNLVSHQVEQRAREQARSLGARYVFGSYKYALLMSRLPPLLPATPAPVPAADEVPTVAHVLPFLPSQRPYPPPIPSPSAPQSEEEQIYMALTEWQKKIAKQNQAVERLRKLIDEAPSDLVISSPRIALAAGVNRTTALEHLRKAGFHQLRSTRGLVVGHMRSGAMSVDQLQANDRGELLVWVPEGDPAVLRGVGGKTVMKKDVRLDEARGPTKAKTKAKASAPTPAPKAPAPQAAPAPKRHYDDLMDAITILRDALRALPNGITKVVVTRSGFEIVGE